MAEEDRILELFERALALEPDARGAFLQMECGDDKPLIAEVRALLEADAVADAAPFWRGSALENEAHKLSESEGSETGTMLGPYQLIEKIGRGGMGDVCRAVRVDSEYRQTVAIKRIKYGIGAASTVARFRTERQILAGLEHPNIARLLDGGTDPQGLPYLVMEFVEGQPLNDYCERRELDVRQRLELFRQICSAVHFAHQRMVIHRDLKPGNILVTEDGTPKLLDFGIAKLTAPDISPDAAPATETAMQMMTPAYASPEQVRGEPVTTASDVYSLGVILYELLGGRSPYKDLSRPQHELLAAVCTEEPQRLSTQAPFSGIDTRRLRGDLDNISLKALKKNPAERYASADQFSEDIRRYLNGMPVLAHGDALSYVTAKFIRRNKLSVTAAILILATLIGGIITTRRAQIRAEERFNDVRQLAHSVLFDYHDAVVALPGAVAIRKMLVKDGLTYLDRLSKQAGNDPGLQLELAGGYMKVADVQGGVNGANLGDARSGLESYRKAIAILEELNRRDPTNQEVQELLGMADRFYGGLCQEAGDPRTGADRIGKGIVLFEKLCLNGQYKMKQQLYSNMYYGMDDRRNVLSGSYLMMGRVSGDPSMPNLGDQKAAERWYRKNIAFLESLPPDKNRLGAIGSTYGYIGTLKAYAGDYPSELAEYRKVLEIKLRIIRMPPVTQSDRRELAVAYSNVGVGLLDTRDLPAALESFQTAAGMFESLTAADPNDAELRTTETNNLRRVAETLSKLKRYPEASTTFQKVIGIYRDLSKKDPANAALQVRLGISYVALSVLHSNTGNGPATSEAAAQAEKTLAPLGDANPTARQLLARSYFQSGKGQELSGNWSAARGWYQRSVDLFRVLQTKGQLAGSNLRFLTDAEKALAESTKKLTGAAKSQTPNDWHGPRS